MSTHHDILQEENRETESATENIFQNLQERTRALDIPVHSIFSFCNNVLACFLYPSIAARDYLRRIVDICSWKFSVFLFITQFVLTGSLRYLLDSVSLPIFKSLDVNADQLQLYLAVVWSPWSTKALLGALSDLFPLGGYNKRYWMLQSIFAGIIGCSLLAFAYQSSAALLVFCFTAMSYQICTCDLMSEGRYSKTIKDNLQSGSDIITFSYGCRSAGWIFAVIVVGPLSDYGRYHAIMIAAFVLSIIPIVPTLLGWLPETKQNCDDDAMRGCRCCMFHHDLYHRNRRIFLLTAIVGFGSPALAVLTTFTNQWVGLILSIIILFSVVILSFWTFPRIIANVNLYHVATVMSQPRIKSGIDYFYTADNACLPGGPDFSYTYYITYTGIIGAVFSFIAVWIYQLSMSTWRYRTVLVVTLILSCVGSLTDLIIVNRWNTAFGISDKGFYIVGGAMLEKVVQMLYNIPSMAVTAKVCPKGLETTVISFLAGVWHFADVARTLLGALILDFSGLRGIPPHCDFSSLWILILSFQIALPLLVGIPASLLIPNVKQTDELLASDEHEVERVNLADLRIESNDRHCNVSAGAHGDDDGSDEKIGMEFPLVRNGKISYH